MRDQFSKHYEELLEGGYDCVDRIVLNAYFPMGVSEGGFRSWWRLLNGSDQGLDNAHLMRMVGRFSRRLRAWAKAHQIPVVDCTVGERKHEIAEEYLSTHELRPGLFMILVFRSPALVWDVQTTGAGKIGNIESQEAVALCQSLPFSDSGPGVGTYHDQNERPSAVRGAGHAQRP